MAELWALLNCWIKGSTCLIPYEFLIVNEETDRVVIISEFVGVSRSLRSFVKLTRTILTIFMII